MSDEHRSPDAQESLPDLPTAPDTDASGAGTEDVRGGAEQRTYTGGRFSLDVAGHNTGYLKKLGPNVLP